MSEAEALELMVGVAASLGMSPEDCEIVARHLVDDELRGAVGMSRIFIVADEVAQHGRQRSEPITVARESGITAVVNAGDTTASSSPSQRPNWRFRRPRSLVSQSSAPRTIGTGAHSATTWSWWRETC